MEGGSADHAGAVICRHAGDLDEHQRSRPRSLPARQSQIDLAAISFGVGTYSASTGPCIDAVAPAVGSGFPWCSKSGRCFEPGFPAAKESAGKISAGDVMITSCRVGMLPADRSVRSA